MRSSIYDGYEKRSDYDPRAHGADCDNCPLRERIPVPPEFNPGARLTALGEAPGKNEVKELRPFVGKSGRLFERFLREHDLRREDCHIDNVILCRPPRNDMKRLLSQIGRENKRRAEANKQRKKDGLEPKAYLKTPLQCCAPRLRHTLDKSDALFVMGRHAFNAAVAPHVGGRDETGLSKWRGFPLKVPAGKDGKIIPVVASNHPAYALRAARFVPVIQNDVGKLVRLMDGTLRWRDPKTVFRPTLEQAREIFEGWKREPPKALVYDLETDGLDPQRTNIRCIGIGTPELAVVIPLHSVFTLDLDGRSERPTHVQIHADDRLIAEGTMPLRKMPMSAGKKTVTLTDEETGAQASFTFHPKRGQEVTKRGRFKRGSWVLRTRPTRGEPRKFCTDGEWSEWAELIEDLFTHPAIQPRLTGHNSIKFDAPICRRNGIVVERQFDSAVGHAIAQSEYFHNLDFLMSVLTDAPKHKGVDHESWHDDETLWRYCAMDVAGQAECAPKVAGMIKRSGQVAAFDVLGQRTISDGKYHGGMAAVCAGLGRAGIQIDLAERDRHRKRLRDRREVAARCAIEALSPKHRRQLQRRLGRKEFKPGSHHQVRFILYEMFGLEPPRDKRGRIMFETDSGELSTSEDATIALLSRGVDEEQGAFLDALLEYRLTDKLSGTYCQGVTRAEYREKVRKYRQGIFKHKPKEPSWFIDEDGRVRADWGPWTVSSRLTGKKPNLMNIPRMEEDAHGHKESLRTMYVASPGHVFVGADMAQLELRLIALVTGDRRWIKAFAEGGDPHKLNVCDAYGIPLAKVNKRLRQFMKTFIYAYCYGCTPKKAMQLMHAHREPNGSRPWAKLTLRETEALFKGLKKKHPDVDAWQENQFERYLEEGCIRSLVTGRRRDFLDSAWNTDDGGTDQLEAMLNFEIQATGADIVNEGTFRLLDKIPWGDDGPGSPGPYGPGLVYQCHDSLVVEVEERYAEWAAQTLGDCMTTTVGKMHFPAEPKIGRTLAEV